MNCAHNTRLNRIQIIQCLSHRSQAVCCAGSSRDNLVFRLQCLLVYAVNDSRQIISSRSGNNNLLSTSIDMSLCLGLACIEACALQNNVNIQLTPRQILSILLRVNSDFLAVNCQCTLLIIAGNCMIPLTMCCVMLQQVSKHGRLCQIIDRNDLIAL